ncbi:MAG TPA: hypothetical protein PKD64_16250 [Pirellulaceae bacterium]|nr:hypothetical protein [Pirellulaceae bacterium]HMO93741.1 hypothetical protein [Pirellulaceae bacterium]HMP69922.1 hypothetical protein [Pirellulaceae bacterium]
MNDRQLDKLLREVSPPDDLHNQLKQLIAHQEWSEAITAAQADTSLDLATSVQAPPNRKSLRWVWAVATVVVAMLTGGLWWLFNDKPAISRPDQSGTMIAESDEQLQTVAPELAALEQQKAESEAELAELEKQLTLHYIELRQVRWAEVAKQSLSKNTRASELAALSLFTAAEAVVLSGLPLELVADNLKLVLERYPNTEGAARAAEMLAGLN